MRHRDLFTLSAVLALAIVYGCRIFLSDVFTQYGIPTGVGWSLFMSLLLASALHSVLTPLNDRWRRLRKERGRDIEEEEKYETEHGMIRLTPNEPASEPADDPIIINGKLSR